MNVAPRAAVVFDTPRIWPLYPGPPIAYPPCLLLPLTPVTPADRPAPAGIGDGSTRRTPASRPAELDVTSTAVAPPVGQSAGFQELRPPPGGSTGAPPGGSSGGGRAGGMVPGYQQGTGARGGGGGGGGGHGTTR